jgi:predicted aconitase
MTMVSEGQKLGSCDGGEVNLKAKEMVAQADKQRAASEKLQAEQCHEFAAQAASPEIMKTQCTDATDRKTFCAAVQTHEKFRPLAEAEKVTNGANRPMSDSAALCGFSVEKQRAKLCSSAESQGKLDFIASQCPAEAEQLAKAQCAGRKYTAISDKYRGFCSSYANTSANDEPADVTPAGAAKSLLNKSKKSLGGLFGR